MQKELVPITNEKEFLASLNEATGRNSLSFIPLIKFDSRIPMWIRLEGKNENGKPKQIEIGETIEFNIIKQRNLLSSKMDKGDKLHSKEVDGNFYELFDENNNQVDKGSMKELKQRHPNLQYNKILYSFLDNEMVRIKLNGSKIPVFIKFDQQFAGDNPARYITKANLGRRMIGSDTEESRPATQEEIERRNSDLKSGRPSNINLFSELIFSKYTIIDDINLIVQRVNKVNEYIKAISMLKTKEVEYIEPEITLKDFEDGSPIPAEPEIDVSKVF